LNISWNQLDFGGQFTDRTQQALKRERIAKDRRVEDPMSVVVSCETAGIAGVVDAGRAGRKPDLSQGTRH
jgi:hypothetical protein